MDYEKKPISVGPWGGQGGSPWDDGVYSTVRQVVITHGVAIDSIQIEYDKKGSSVWAEKRGGNGGEKTDKLQLHFPDEFLTSIHGHFGNFKSRGGPIAVRSLTFESNRKTYGPFGVERGTYFSLPMTGGKMVGFHGKSGWYLDAIGSYLKPLYKANPSRSLVNSKSVLASGPDKLGYSILQGGVGPHYDIVLAFRQKDDWTNSVLPVNLSSESSSHREFSDMELKEKNHGVASSIERVSSNVKGTGTFGPWGGNGGSKFNDGIYKGVRQINVSRNVGIVSIKVLYDHNGESTWGPKNGGTGGYKSDKIVFDYPYEILTHITGFYGPTMLMGPVVIKSLTFHTTKMKYGPFGEEQGISFSSNTKEGMIVGFHGKKGLFVDAIGVHVIEGKVTPTLRSTSNSFNQSDLAIAEVDNPDWSNKLVLARRGPAEEVKYSVMKEPAPLGPGPWGGDGGRPWDDGVFSGIKQIFLMRSDVICSIQIEYDRSGQSVWSVKHGGNGGIATHRIRLEYPHEVVTCICGYYDSVGRDEKAKVITSLSFYTSRGKYGPFGEEIGTFFTSTKTEGKVVGFHGRSGSYLDAIGVHMQHWLGYQALSKPSFFKIFN